VSVAAAVKAVSIVSRDATVGALTSFRNSINLGHCSEQSVVSYCSGFARKGRVSRVLSADESVVTRITFSQLGQRRTERRQHLNVARSMVRLYLVKPLFACVAIIS